MPAPYGAVQARKDIQFAFREQIPDGIHSICVLIL